MGESIWVPLEDGQYTRPNWNNVGEVTLGVSHDGSELEEWHSSNPSNREEIGLPDEYRICRLTTAPDAAPSVSREVRDTAVGALAYTKAMLLRSPDWDRKYADKIDAAIDALKKMALVAPESMKGQGDGSST